MRSLFYTPRGKPRFVAPALLLLGLTATLALGVLRWVGHPPSDEARVTTLLRTGQSAEAERLAARVVQQQPTVPHVLALVRAHESARKARLGHTMPTAMSDADLIAVLDGLPADVGVVGRFALGSEEARSVLEEAAQRNPPMPYANDVLATVARDAGDYLGAAELYWREGTTFADRHEDIDDALRCWMEVGAWEIIADRMQTPRVAEGASPSVRYEVAVHERDWRTAVRVLPALYLAHFDRSFLWLAGVAALAWAFFCARLGRMAERPRVRVPLYIAAFALGVLSVGPTLVLVAVEEAKLHLVETGDVVRDLLFFVFGVGLREEASKLLLFAMLLPVLRKWGDKLDVLVCGAMVGLGFAAEENLGYLADQNLHTGLGRFLTANFLHMAMTGILASALDDFVRDPEEHAPDFTRTALLVVGLHGAYDFLIAHNEVGGAFLAMGVFVILTKLFLDRVDVARRHADRVITPMHAFVLALAVVTGACLAHAIDTVGLERGFLAMTEGLLGEAVMVIVFARVLAVYE